MQQAAERVGEIVIITIPKNSSNINGSLFVTVGLISMFLFFCRMRGSRGLAVSDPPLACFCLAFALPAWSFRFPLFAFGSHDTPKPLVLHHRSLSRHRLSFSPPTSPSPSPSTLTLQLPFISSPPGRTASSCRPGSGALYLLSRVPRHFGRSTCILPRTPLSIQQLKVRDISHLTAPKPSSAVDHMIAITVSSTPQLNSNHLQLHFHCA